MDPEYAKMDVPAIRRIKRASLEAEQVNLRDFGRVIGNQGPSFFYPDLKSPIPTEEKKPGLLPQ